MTAAVPAARVLVRARGGADGAGRASCSRPSGRAPSGWRTLGPDEGLGWRPAGDRLPAARRGTGRCSWRAASARPRSCAGRTSSTDAPVLLGFRCAAHAQAAALFQGEPQVATDDGSVGRQALVTELLARSSTRDPRGTVYACGPPRDARGRAGAVRRARGAGPARAWSPEWPADSAPASAASSRRRDGYVRLCVDGPVLDAELETAWRAVHDDVELCGVSLRGPSSTGPGPSTRSRPGAPSATRCSSASRSTPSSRRRSRSRRARAIRRRGCGRPRPGDQLDRAPEQGPRRASSSPTCRCSRSCPCR